MSNFNSSSRIFRRRQTALEYIEKALEFYSNSPKTKIDGRTELTKENFVSNRLEALQKEKEVLEKRLRFNHPQRKTIKRNPIKFA